MRFRWLSGYWAGAILSLGLLIMALSLAVHGKLAFYIHPRYIWFTVILSGLALLCIIADAATRLRTPFTAKHIHVLQAGTGLLCIACCLAFLLLRPVSLTSSAAGQRGINTAPLATGDDSSLADLRTARADYTQFSLREWASLLAQTNDISLFAGKSVQLSGFVSPTPENDPNVFYVSRFVLTCCAVDARPVGVAVYHPAWQKEYQPDQWLDVKGSFVQNPERSSSAIVIKPQTILPIEEPDQPYDY